MDEHQPTVADRLRTARRAGFVGRSAELALVERSLAAAELPFCVLFVHGPGGVGKTALLEELGGLAERAGRPVVRVDARSLDPSTVQTALGEPPPRAVVLLDTFELMETLDHWLRATYVPSLPADVLVVLAGRNPPTTGWSAEPGWADLVHVLPLRNLRPVESRAFLTARAVPDAQHEPVIAFTHGHPLALTLVAEVVAADDDGAPFRASREPDVVRTLVQQFVAQVPGPRHRDALEACAHLRTTTEERLAEALGGGDDVPDLFAWLRGLSFTEATEQGLILHDLAREVLEADLRWRNPERYLRLHLAVRAAVVERIQQATGLAQQRALFDLLYLHRRNPVMAAFHRWDTMGTAYAEPATDADLPEVLAMVERHEGTESARLAAHWYARQPGAFETFRTLDRELIGFTATLALHDAAPADLQEDPATRAAVEFARRFGPLRTGEQMVYSRFAMGRDAPHEAGPARDLIALTSARSFLTWPRLAWNVIAVPDPAVVDAVFTHLNLRRSPEADFRTDGTTFAVYTHDWRAEPVAAWLELMSRREIAAQHEEAATDVAAAPLVVLSEPEFAAEVRRALRAFTRSDVLAASPLLRSRVVVDRGGRDARAAELQVLLREAAESLRTNPRDEKFYRAVERTYLNPAATQERAAEALGLPFSTFRSHLTSGVDRITDWLWRRELDGAQDLART